jgi:OTU domain-containing protein 6
MKLRKKSRLMHTMINAQLRKAAEHASRFTNDDKEADARLEAEIRHEEKVIKAVCDDLHLTMFEVRPVQTETACRPGLILETCQINPDGHCLYAAVADQLRLLNIIPPETAHYATTRAAAASYMAAHPNDFLPFLPSTEGEDGVGAGDAGLMNPRQFQRGSTYRILIGTVLVDMCLLSTTIERLKTCSH